jgi:hypothetical protein
MDGSNDDNKIELSGALRSYKISPKRQKAAAHILTKPVEAHE